MILIKLDMANKGIGVIQIVICECSTADTLGLGFACRTLEEAKHDGKHLVKRVTDQEDHCRVKGVLG